MYFNVGQADTTIFVHL